MSKNADNALTVADVADILSRALALAVEAGLMVGVRNADANAKRPDGLMIYVATLRTSGDGRIFAQEVAAPLPTPPAPAVGEEAAP